MIYQKSAVGVFQKRADVCISLRYRLAKSPFGDSDGPVPLPVWAKRERAPRPAPSPLVGVHAPTLAIARPLPLLPVFSLLCVGFLVAASGGTL